MSNEHKEIEERLDKIEKCLYQDGPEFQVLLEDLHKIVRGDPAKKELGLETIVYGSKELGVESIRDTLNRVAKTHDRVLWLLGILGIGTISTAVGWLLFLINKGPVP